MKKKSRKRIIKIICFSFLGLLISVGAIIYTWRKSLTIQYPKKYEETVNRYAEEFGLDPHLVFAIIKAESSFKEETVSAKGATGLMQLMPVTAQAEAKRLGMKDYTQEDLIKPEVNSRLGCKYFSRLIEAFGNTKCAIAAYNCGPNRVGEWLDSKVYSVDGVNLDNIPYAETRKYVEKVLKSYEMYNKIYKNYN